MICCGEFRKTNFCPDCGNPIDSDTAKSSLIEYLRIQEKKVESNYKSRLKANPNMDTLYKERWENNIRKWTAWIKWVSEANQK